MLATHEWVVSTEGAHGIEHQLSTLDSRRFLHSSFTILAPIVERILVPGSWADLILTIIFHSEIFPASTWFWLDRESRIVRSLYIALILHFALRSDSFSSSVKLGELPCSVYQNLALPELLLSILSSTLHFYLLSTICSYQFLLRVSIDNADRSVRFYVKFPLLLYR